MLTLIALTLLTIPSVAQDAARPAATILAEYDSIRLPSSSAEFGAGEEASAAFERELFAGCRRHAALALELRAAHPEHARVPELLAKRWAVLANTFDEPDRVIIETSFVIADGANAEALKGEAQLARAWAASKSARLDLDGRLGFIEKALVVRPDAQLLPMALTDIAIERCADPERARALAERALALRPDDPWVANPAKGLLRRLALVGEGFELPILETRSGAPITLTGEVGTWTIVHAFATTDGEASIDFDALRDVREQRAGLRLVGLQPWGVQGSADALHAFLELHHVDWPVAYDEGSPFDGWSATELHLARSPYYFLLDATGELVTISARLDTLLERLVPREG